jgi:hypothetical protein
MLFTPHDNRTGDHALVHDHAQHIDTMRGLALLGVIIMNIGSMVMMVNGRQIFAAASAFDLTMAGLDLVFVLGKARSCFAFLFGAGFAILMMRAEAKGAAMLRSTHTSRSRIPVCAVHGPTWSAARARAGRSSTPGATRPTRRNMSRSCP